MHTITKMIFINFRMLKMTTIWRILPIIIFFSICLSSNLVSARESIISCKHGTFRLKSTFGFFPVIQKRQNGGWETWCDDGLELKDGGGVCAKAADREVAISEEVIADAEYIKMEREFLIKEHAKCMKEIEQGRMCPSWDVAQGVAYLFDKNSENKYELWSSIDKFLEDNLPSLGQKVTVSSMQNIEGTELEILDFLLKKHQRRFVDNEGTVRGGYEHDCQSLKN